MLLGSSELANFDRDGFLIIRKLFSEEEVFILRKEAARIAQVEAECVIREGKSKTPKIMFRMHETDGPTGSKIYNATPRLPRILRPAIQLLQDDQLYLHHSKINLKSAIEGSVWPWHQDFGQWQLDGIKNPDLVTFMIMLDNATEVGGCLYFQPASHKSGRIKPFWDETTPYKFLALPPDDVRRSLREGLAPVPITGKPGDTVIFHCNLLHASGQNLSPTDRWQVYFCFNRVSNHPSDVEQPRPDYVRSLNWSVMEAVDDTAIIQAEAIIS